MTTEAAVKQAEASINALIEQRAQQGKERDLWTASAARHAAQLRQAAREEWASYHAHMCRLHAQLAREHRAKAKRLLEGR